jgi:hypothetical protein
MESSFESVCGSIPWKADKKFTYELMKNKKNIFQRAHRLCY